MNPTDDLLSVYRSDDPAVLLKTYGYDDAYGRGVALFVVPALFTSMPAPLQAAVRARRRAALTGACLLCASELDIRTEAGRVEVRHDDDCPARDARIGPALAQWRGRVGLYAKGRRITEDPLAGAADR